MALAEFNFGTLKYDWDDPRLSDFRDNLDLVNGIAARSDGFIWTLPAEDMDATQNDPEGPLAERPNTASTLSVWQDAKTLWSFVNTTLHARFLNRANEWFQDGDSGHLVVWRCAADHQPNVAEAMGKWRQLQSDGPSDNVFGGVQLRALSKR
jgi:hypothetical protein